MKHFLSFGRRAAALALALLLAAPTALAAAGDRKLQTTTPVVDGLTFSNTITDNNGSRVESFSLELAADSGVYPILIQAAGTIYGAASINRAVTTAQEMGYHVVGGINTAFFDTSSGVPIGIAIEDGVYLSSGDSNAMVIIDDRISVQDSSRVSLTLTNRTRGGEVVPHHFNKLRQDSGGLYLLNRHFSTVNTHSDGAGWYVRMEMTDPEELTVNDRIELVVTELLQSEQSIAIGENEYILTAADAGGYRHVFDSFQVGDRITLETSCEDEALSEAQWAGGVGDIMVWDGQMTDSAGWTYTKDGRQPRSAMGMRADGTLVLYAVDGRRSGYSVGLSQRDLADEMLARGCVWAVNLDGGGSTAMTLWVPGQAAPAVQNRPSDGRPRGCATYLLLVTDQVGDGRPDRLALAQDGLTVLAGTSLPLSQATALDDGLELISTDLSDLTVDARLGAVAGGVYTAGDTAGTDTLTLRAGGLTGSAQVHVVDHLTDLKITRAGTDAALTTLQVEPGEQVQLAIEGSYWGRTALHELSAVTYTAEGQSGTIDANGLFTASAERGSGSITISAGGQSRTIQVVMKNVHDDVPEGNWAYEAVKYCYEKGIVGGISPTQFGPALPISRADFMVMLYNAAGRPAVDGPASFPDVPEGMYYSDPIAWGEANKLAGGDGDGNFSPSTPITREQAFTILYRALPVFGKACPDAPLEMLDAFPDAGLISPFAQQATATLVGQGLVSGGSSGIDPHGRLARAQMAVLLHRLLEHEPITDYPQPEEPEQPEEPRPPAEQPRTGTVTNAELGLNLRSGPGSDYDRVAKLANGAQVEILEELEGWYRVRTGDGAEGYASADYVTINP